jgi:ATP-dependent exoDNAse (exonuclease V) beta subunit
LRGGTPSPASVPRSPAPTSDTTEFLLKGFLDLVRFDPDTGEPTLILDYKTGNVPTPGSPEDRKHAEQLRTYRAALAAKYSCAPARIALCNYYPATQITVQRS